MKSLRDAVILTALLLVGLYFVSPGPEGYSKLTRDYHDEPMFIGEDTSAYIQGNQLVAYMGSFPAWPTYESFDLPSQGTCETYATLTVMDWENNQLESAHRFEICNPKWPSGYWGRALDQ